MTWFPRFLYPAAFAAGLAAIAWIAAGYGGGHALALVVCGLILAAYLAGAVELQRQRAALATLHATLQAPPGADLPAWLARLHPTLRTPVQRRLDGERAALPAPSLTPYLVGLLVLLGMVGTFLGMVVTLKGTVTALESTADLQAMRTALAAPVRGLGLAFGTSVAGVCASAMLGLMAALVRRQRQQHSAALDALLATTLRPHTRAHRREQERAQWQAQAAQLPALVDGVQALMARLAEQDRSARADLAAEQARFHQQAEAAYGGLARAVERSLAASLAEGARLAGATLQPAVERTLAGLAQQAGALHAQVGDTLQRQGQALADGLQATLARAEAAQAERSTALLGELGRRFDAQATALVDTLAQQQASQQRTLAAHEADRLTAWTTTLEAAATQMRQATQAHAEATIAEVARLMHTAAEAPRVAAEVIGQLREQLSASMAHDNTLLDERRQLMASLAALLQQIDDGTQRQQSALDALESRFAARVEASVATLESAAAQTTAGAVEVASLAEVFGQAVLRYGEASDRLVGQLQRVEAALAQAAARSDDQLAYVVAQAREVIDLSLLSQKQILDEMQQMARRQAALADEAR